LEEWEVGRAKDLSAPQYKVTVNVEQSRNRPGVAQKVPGIIGAQIFMIFGTERW